MFRILCAGLGDVFGCGGGKWYLPPPQIRRPTPEVYKKQCMYGRRVFHEGFRVDIGYIGWLLRGRPVAPHATSCDLVRRIAG